MLLSHLCALFAPAYVFPLSRLVGRIALTPGLVV